MLIITTGISGCGRKEFLALLEKFSKSRKKSVKIYHVGQMIFEQAEKIGITLTAENVLNANPHVLNSLRSAVFEIILSTLKNDLKTYDAVFINIHAFFLWRKIFIKAYDRFYPGQFNADAFVTFIDNAQDMKKRLDKRPQWKPERLTIEEILLWQNIEVEVTSSWADMNLKPFYVIPAKQTVSGLYRLVFQPEQEPVYISMPITHLREKKMQSRVNKFIEELNKYFIVFDPRVVELGSRPAIVKIGKKRRENPVFFTQVVNRDLYWFVRQSKKVIAFFPKVVSSPGVINELREAHETNKTVWVIHPGGQGSPFITYYCDKIFDNEKEFFEFLKKNYKQFKDHFLVA
jgi:adenylate kinase